MVNWYKYNLGFTPSVTHTVFSPVECIKNVFVIRIENSELK